MNYATGCAFNLDQMFLNFPFDKLELTCKEAKSINNNEHRDFLVKKIFRNCLKKVINDVIDNNTTFYLNSGKIKSEIHMKRIHGEQFSKARQNGKFSEIDFLKSFFSGYELEFTMKSGDKLKRTKNIYVDPRLKQKIIENTNNGKQYC